MVLVCWLAHFGFWGLVFFSDGREVGAVLGTTCKGFAKGWVFGIEGLFDSLWLGDSCVKEDGAENGSEVR